MRVDLHAATDVAQYVIFDPAAVPEWIRHDLPFPSGADWLSEPAAQGNLLDYRDDCDAEIRIRVYIDEEPEQRLLELSQQTLSGAVLNVPGGELWCVGAECIKADSAEHSTPQTYLPGRGIVETHAEIPAGIYSVCAYEGDLDELEGRFLEELPPETRKVIERFNTLSALGCLLAAASFVGMLGLSLWIGTDGFWARAAWIVAASAVPIALFWAYQWLLLRSPRYDEALQQQAVAMSNWPQLLLHLRTIPESEVPSAPTPGILGPRPSNSSRTDG